MRKICFFVMGAVLLLPSVSYANAGTGLIFATGFHLLIGNLIIGTLEGTILSKVFRIPRNKSHYTMILANYFSAWVGGVFITQGILSLIPVTIENATGLFWLFYCFTYLLTLLLEFPFVAFLLRKEPNRLRKSVFGSLLVQTISYCLLSIWFWLPSGKSILTDTSVVSLDDIIMPKNIEVYYIADSDGDVYATDLQSEQQRKVFDLNSTNLSERLIARVNSSNHWDIIATSDSSETACGLLPQTAIPPSTLNPDKQPKNNFHNFGPALQLGSAHTSHWSFRSEFWAAGGLRGTQTQSEIHLAMETPFFIWYLRNAYHLPSDMVLFQWGENQICIYDPETKKVALLAKGRGPLPILLQPDSMSLETTSPAPPANKKQGSHK